MRIPREFELPGNDAIMRKGGERLIIEPSPPNFMQTCAFAARGGSVVHCRPIAYWHTGPASVLKVPLSENSPPAPIEGAP